MASTDIVPSKMIADIKAIGIDLANPGDLAKMDMSKKKKLMPFFVKALGMSGCDGCHVAGDFKAATHNKQMASSMWNHFVKDLRANGGGAMFCDSCHQGKQKLLDRSDKKALSKFMIANYEDKLAARRQEGSLLRDLPRRSVRRKGLRQAVEGRSLTRLLRGELSRQTTALLTRAHMFSRLANHAGAHRPSAAGARLHSIAPSPTAATRRRCARSAHTWASAPPTA